MEHKIAIVCPIKFQQNLYQVYEQRGKIYL